jgi:hypothetical protein
MHFLNIAILAKVLGLRNAQICGKSSKIKITQPLADQALARPIGGGQADSPPQSRPSYWFLPSRGGGGPRRKACVARISLRIR